MTGKPLSREEQVYHSLSFYVVAQYSSEDPKGELFLKLTERKETGKEGV